MFIASSVDEISRKLRGLLQTEVSETGGAPWVWPNNFYVIVKVLAAALRGLELRIENIHRQRFAVLADNEYLDLHAEDIGLARMHALYAAGNIIVTADPGVFIPLGTQFSNTSDSVTYETLSNIVTAGATTTIPVRASEAGTQGNLEPDAPLTLVSPITGVSGAVVDLHGIIGGTDPETDNSLRERILFHKRNPPRGGAPSEYIEWSLTKPGVTRVWVKRATPNPGQVTVYFTMDQTFTYGIPPIAEVTDLQEQLNELAPADADVIVAAPDVYPVDITIDTIFPDTTKIREDVTKEIEAMFHRKANPGEVFSLSWISEAIASTPGVNRHTISAPAMDLTPDPGELPVPGVIAFGI